MKILVPLMMLLLVSCTGDNIYSPKPRMYPRVIFPEKQLKEFKVPSCDFNFVTADYFSVVQDEYFYDEETQHPCWFDLEASIFNAAIHCSYFPLSTRAELDELINDAFKVTNRHNVKAAYIEDLIIDRSEANVHGLLFNVEGPVASPLQFYLTDSVQHFFRASLYFNSKVDPDSTAVVLDYVRSDINEMIGSWKWK